MRISNPENYELVGFRVNIGSRFKYDGILRNKTLGTIRRIPFGGKKWGIPYPQYHDKIGYYSEYDHNDKKRQQSFYNRHKRNLGHRYSSAWFAWTYLWSD